MSSDLVAPASTTSGTVRFLDSLLGAMGPDRSLTERVALFAAEYVVRQARFRRYEGDFAGALLERWLPRRVA